MTKVDVGDYLLPGNDGRSIFRLTRMDPPAEGWSLWRWRGSIHSMPGPTPVYGSPSDCDPAEWDSWELVASELLSRGEAEREAIRLAPTPAGA